MSKSDHLPSERPVWPQQKLLFPIMEVDNGLTGEGYPESVLAASGVSPEFS